MVTFNERTIVEKIMNSKGSEKTNLLGVLDQATHHNAPNSYHLGMGVARLTGRFEDAEETVTTRCTLVQRHIRDAQEALKKIYSKAKEKGYREITEIFEREYFVGHSFEDSNSPAH